MWCNRGMRLIFTANLVSMIGSGMSSAAVIWYILQAMHSEVSRGAMCVVAAGRLVAGASCARSGVRDKRYRGRLTDSSSQRKSSPWRTRRNQGSGLHADENFAMTKVLAAAGEPQFPRLRSG